MKKVCDFFLRIWNKNSGSLKSVHQFKKGHKLEKYIRDIKDVQEFEKCSLTSKVFTNSIHIGELKWCSSIC